MRKKISLILLLLLSTYPVMAAELSLEKLPKPLADNPKTLEKKETEFFELIQDNLKPEQDEFYLTMIFGTTENPKALIKRSTNTRASDVYSESVAYGIGDKIADDYVVEAIDFKSKEVIVKKISSGEYYSLLLSYGAATSRLVKKQNYKKGL